MERYINNEVAKLTDIVSHILERVKPDRWRDKKERPAVAVRLLEIVL
ncbi:MAG: hypothetical protein Q8P32_01320 [Candidatus Komeilibacteria bacterium]|nr:hypothetical protein [Candidatus Komeilibacteria bacterium]